MPRYSLIAGLVASVSAEQFHFSESGLDQYSLKIFRMLTVSASTTHPGHFQATANLEGADGKAMESPKGLSLVIAEKKWFDASSKDSFCCTSQDVSTGKCKTEMDFVGASENGPAYSLEVSNEAGHMKKFTVSKEGMYYVGLVHCGDKQVTGAKVVGSVQAKSSHGYLSAMDVQALYFSAFLLIVYLVLFVAWCWRCLSMKDQLVSVHYVLMGVLATCVLATGAKYAMYNFGNVSEMSTTAAQVFADILGVCKFGTGVVAAVMISLGYGTAHESVGSSDLTWLLGYGVIFCGFAGIRCIVLLSSGDSGISQPLFDLPDGMPAFLESFASMQTLIVLPEALVFGSIANWGYTSLLNLKAVLEEQKQHETLKIMTSFFRSLQVGVAALVCVILGQIYLQANYEMSDLWHSLWIMDEALPNLIFAACLSWTLLAFWPTENFRAKAFSQQINFDDAELDDIIGADGVQLPEGDIEMADNTSGKYLE